MVVFGPSQPDLPRVKTCFANDNTVGSMAYTRLSEWLGLVLFLLNFLTTEGSSVDITYLHSAVNKGAVCLDGSPPAYHFQKGSGSGINSWMVYHAGGGWCDNVADCLNRTTRDLGSSKHMTKQLNFTGIMSNQQELNPYFYNWNIILIRYCDGSSFTGDVEAVDPATNLHFRGARIWNAVMEDLLAKGMKNAENAILTGCSAGGLATILHCDNFQALFPNTKVTNILVPKTADPHGTWKSCNHDIRNCSSDQIGTMQHFRTKFLHALSGLKKNSESNGMFIDSCYVHCQIDRQETWFRNDSTVVRNKKLANEVGDWFYDDKYRPLQEPDCPYPCNPTCYNIVIWKAWNGLVFDVVAPNPLKVITAACNANLEFHELSNVRLGLGKQVKMRLDGLLRLQLN
ncbi:hypothetical protein FEM48_Zijuj11G0150600 [Ziziphus jujuba var. spinosa]|uniref:Pectin acetylesterase n=1 Tax=Ziziphus jujuba var. spinosa TaxID=714518 RepID=A0A978UJM6_ZIZJJ|nr:hypothetical protein FEM48_Zijuj11G0150600 [Ziziphus jujuba var. spinosa]